MSDIDIDVLSRVVRDFDAEEEKALLRENGLHPQCKYCGGDYLLRDECEVVALCDDCTHEAVPALLDERDQLRAERDALARRRDELLVTVRNLSLQTPYPEEAGNAGVLIAEVGTLKAKLAEVEKELSHERELTDARKIVRRAERKIVRDEHLTELQRESARVNEMSGVIAHLVGVLVEVHRATSIENAHTFAEIALANIEAWHADAWKPGPSDDAADWKPGHWRKEQT